MSIFDQFVASPKAEAEKDVIAGSGYGPLESGAYEAVIDMCYLDVSKNGAYCLNFVFKTKDGATHKETIYFTNRSGETFYKDKNGNEQNLPGFNTVTSICLLTVGQELNVVGQDAEEKMVNIWNYDLKKEVPTKKKVLMPLLGQEVTLGIQKCIEDKYNKPGETVEKAQIDKVFRAADHLTTAEIRKGQSEAEFYTRWVEDNTGKTRNKAKLAGQTPAATPSAGASASPFGSAPVAAKSDNPFG